MTYVESELLPLSALQHLVFCERQCALIHLEQIWEENRLTVEGKILHERVDQGATQSRKDLRISNGLKMHSLQLGLIGKADTVEFYQMAKDQKSPVDSDGNVVFIQIPGLKGLWRPFPVEYKHGKPKEDQSDEVQLCAQAICLEEMLGADILTGSLFYGTTHRRKEVVFNDQLRCLTKKAAGRLHALFQSGKTPPADYRPKCDKCSLINICMPARINRNMSVERYISKFLTLEEDD